MSVLLGEVGPQVSKLSGDDHQMSVAGSWEGAGPQVNKFEQVPRFDVLRPSVLQKGYPYHVTYPMMHVM